MSTKPNHVAEVVATILNERKGRELPELTDADYLPFLESIELLLGDPDFVHQHLWETHTLEHPVSRPNLDVSNKEECEKKIHITMTRCEEKDARSTTVFEGHVGTITVDGYVLVKGRHNVYPEQALKALFRKVNTWAREWKANYAGSEPVGGEKS